MNPSPTIKQTLHFFTLVEQKGTPDDQLQALYASGLISDLLDANIQEINRDEFRRICGLKPLMPELKVWKKIKLGVHRTPQAYRKALEAKGFRIGTYASQILNKIAVTETEVEVDLCRLTVREIGFNRNARYDEVCKRIIELGGLIDETGEVGPALRDQYPGQPYGEWNAVAMKAMADLGGDLRVFGVGRDDDELWLRAGCGGPDCLFPPGARVVFAVPRK